MQGPGEGQRAKLGVPLVVSERRKEEGGAESRDRWESSALGREWPHVRIGEGTMLVRQALQMRVALDRGCA